MGEMARRVTLTEDELRTLAGGGVVLRAADDGQEIILIAKQAFDDATAAYLDERVLDAVVISPAARALLARGFTGALRSVRGDQVLVLGPAAPRA